MTDVPGRRGKMNKKLITLALLLFSCQFAFAETSHFFPGGEGYKITNKNWGQLTEKQKAIFIQEANKEIERNEPVTIKPFDMSFMISVMDEMVLIIQDQIPKVEFAMIRILLDMYKENGLIKIKTTNEIGLS